MILWTNRRICIVKSYMHSAVYIGRFIFVLLETLGEKTFFIYIANEIVRYRSLHVIHLLFFSTRYFFIFPRRKIFLIFFLPSDTNTNNFYLVWRLPVVLVQGQSTQVNIHSRAVRSSIGDRKIKLKCKMAGGSAGFFPFNIKRGEINLVYEENKTTCVHTTTTTTSWTYTYIR